VLLYLGDKRRINDVSNGGSFDDAADAVSSAHEHIDHDLRPGRP